MIPSLHRPSAPHRAKEFSLVSAVLTQRTAVAANAELRRKGGF